MSVLKKQCLVLNRNWQAIHTKTVAEICCMLATGVALALDIEGPESMRPVTWDEWIALPIREQDDFIQTPRHKIRVPTVVIAVNYYKVPRKRPKLTAKNIRLRDGGRCAYTGEVVGPDRGNIDHVLPRSRGGKDEWTNMVWAKKEINTKKGAKTPEEAGLKLLKTPRQPLDAPASSFLTPSHPDHEHFLK